MSFDKQEWSAKRYQERKAELAARRASPQWKAKRKEWVIEHRAKNRDKLNEYDRARYFADPKRRKKSVTKEQKARWDKAYRVKHAAHLKDKSRSYYLRNREACLKNGAAYMARRLKNDDAFRLLNVLRARVRMAVKNQATSKAFSTIELIGCDIPTLRAHLEAQFKPEMTWDNHGLHGWHIDHRKACSLYDLTDPAQQRECFHFSNLQPLWWHDNISKGNKTL